MFLKNQSPKRPPTKHFMAPTISAASKAAIPRNKVLTDRNESSDSSETHHQSTSNLVPKASPVHRHNSFDLSFSRKASSQARVYESNTDENNSHFSDSSSKPYDPLTNYLSPRPKFLRYNPNSHRKMFIQRKTEIGTDNEGSDCLSSSVSCSLESSDATENEDIDIFKEDDDHDLEAKNEEIEDSENEGCLSLKGVFKFLLVSVALLILTWYISCMNSSAPSPRMHLIRGSTDGYVNGYNRTCDIVDVNSYRDGSVNVIDEKRKRISEFFGHVLDEDSGIEEGSFNQSKGIQITGSVERPGPSQDVQIPTISDLVSSYVLPNGDYLEFETELKGVDREKENKVSETEVKYESFEEYQTQPIFDFGDIHVFENEAKGNLVFKGSIVETEGETESIEGGSVEGDGKIEENEMGSVDIAEEGSSVEFSSIKNSEYSLIYGAFICFFLIIASAIFAFLLRCKRTPIGKSQPIKKPLHNSFSGENISSEDPLFPNMEEAHIEKDDSYANPSIYFPSVGENSMCFPLTHAPTVELLGELVVGDSRSSMKSYSAKNKANEIEMQTKEMDFQAEKRSIFVDKAINNSAHLSTPEFSASTVSPSYAIYTPAKKILKEEEGSAKTTPVRRSNRIRSRAMHP